MKKVIFICIMTLAGLGSLGADEAGRLSIGLSVAAGGRYDNVRMCIASPAGVPGGIALEPLALVMEYRINEQFGIGTYLPVARPLIFALNTQMLQFLPEIVFNIHIPVDEFSSIVIHPALGASLHWGPDYYSDQENRGPEFFAMGPRISVLGGVALKLSEQHEIILGLKPYAELLFSDYLSGFVVGGELDFQYRYTL